MIISEGKGIFMQTSGILRWSELQSNADVMMANQLSIDYFPVRIKPTQWPSAPPALTKQSFSHAT